MLFEERRRSAVHNTYMLTKSDGEGVEALPIGDCVLCALLVFFCIIRPA